MNKISHLSLVMYSSVFIVRQELNFHLFVDTSGASMALKCPTAYNLHHLTHYNFELPQASLEEKTNRAYTALKAIKASSMDNGIYKGRGLAFCNIKN
jgi:hypothetical protein